MKDFKYAKGEAESKMLELFCFRAHHETIVSTHCTFRATTFQNYGLRYKLFYFIKSNFYLDLERWALPFYILESSLLKPPNYSISSLKK